jgi:hypothetical protein
LGNTRKLKEKEQDEAFALAFARAFCLTSLDDFPKVGERFLQWHSFQQSDVAFTIGGNPPQRTTRSPIKHSSSMDWSGFILDFAYW